MKNSGKKHITGAQQKQRLGALKEDNRSHFANKEFCGQICGQISLLRMPRPKGKIYKD